jgi:hypothetical protein
MEDKPKNPIQDKFFEEMSKSKDLNFDYEVAKMMIEDDGNLISKMYYYDKDSKQNSNFYILINNLYRNC